MPTNSTLTFVDRQNNVITRTLVAKKRHWNYTPDLLPYPDLTVGLLDSDVPTNLISFAKVLPDNYADYIRDGRQLPAVRLDQEEKALVGDVLSVKSREEPPFIAYCDVPETEARLTLYEPIVIRDSGNPAFIFIDGQPIILTVWTDDVLGGNGTSVTALKADINQLMLDLGGGYQLIEIDFSEHSLLP